MAIILISTNGYCMRLPLVCNEGLMVSSFKLKQKCVTDAKQIPPRYR